MAKAKPPSEPKKPKVAKPQRERFIDFAREHGADDPDALDKALGEIESTKPKKDGDYKA